jgi:hypothetical protein
MVKGKATTKENPKARAKALPKKVTKPAPKKPTATQSNKNKGTTSRKRVADDEFSDEEPDPRPRKKCAKCSAPASDEEDGDEVEVVPEVIGEEDEDGQSDSEVPNLNQASIQKVNNTF